VVTLFIIFVWSDAPHKTLDYINYMNTMKTHGQRDCVYRSLFFSDDNSYVLSTISRYRPHSPHCPYCSHDTSHAKLFPKDDATLNLRKVLYKLHEHSGMRGKVHTWYLSDTQDIIKALIWRSRKIMTLIFSLPLI